jgi:predicted unusual protein kinase regulating ubiquinone biosynthesis (AarF/ABC1/UbiB family)
MSTPQASVSADLKTPYWRKVRRQRFVAVARLFWFYILEYWLEWWQRRVLGEEHAARTVPQRRRKQAIRFRETAIRMGGLLIKQGQFLSSRVDLLPMEFINELVKLQDEVPGVTLDAIQTVIEHEFGRPVKQIFERFEPVALAAASLGQVHQATLFSGESVAVKVQRPGIEHIIEIDLDSMRWVIRRLRRWTSLGRSMDLEGIAREFTATLRAELDFVGEGHNAEEFQKVFSSDKRVEVPRVYWDYTTRRVLTLQYVEGVKITDYAGLESAGISRSAVADTLLNLYFQQIFDEGFFHADPHPGNLFVRPGPVIVFIDFGMMGRITAEVRRETKRLLTSIVNRDAAELVDCLVALGFLLPHADIAAVRAAFSWLLNRYYKSTLAELAESDPREILQEVGAIFYQQPFQIPANYIFLGRAVGTLSGLSTGLAPELNVIRVAEPYVRRLAIGDSGKEWTSLILDQAKDYGRLALQLPKTLERTLGKADRGELEVRIQAAELNRTITRIERAGRQMVQTLLAASLIVAGTMFQTGGHEWRGWICFGVALAILVGGLFSNRLRRR